LKGSSDIIGVLPSGRFLACECKAAGGGRLSPEQREFLDRVQRDGGLALVVSDPMQLAERLEAEGYGEEGLLF
jgi:hypothetical protein